MTLEKTYLTAKHLIDSGKISQDIFRDLMDTEIVAVVHAHWEEQVYSGGKLFFRCSECGHGFTPVHGHTYNYCFCCGAKMDEEIDDA